jgi:XRE family transcriptional regulator, regulator of sulfur utilization
VTLGKIERGEMNPTIGILWKIANGLTIPLTELLEPTGGDVGLSRARQSVYVQEDQGLWTIEPVFRTEQGYYDIFRACLRQQSEYHPEIHRVGTEEIVTVMQGQLTMIIDGKTYQLNELDSIRFKASLNHVYRNESDETVFLQLILRYR